MPSAEYEMNYGAATYNPNASHATMATNKDQQPLQQELQTYFCDNTGLLQPCSSSATYPYNGRYEIINAVKTAENAIPVNMPSAEYEMNYGAATYSPTASHATMVTNKDQQPLHQEQQTYFHDNLELFQNGYRSSDANRPYNLGYRAIKANGSAKNAVCSKVNSFESDKKDQQMPTSEMSFSTDLSVMVDKAILLQKDLVLFTIAALFLYLASFQANM
ncbi:hypothetical protein T4A_459 [Trichinella pseudospiralis]|uniref:Uncharacterized protein n=2 Tax=Trichinella pseudospiralis TaxID=6337 RepID=A0A0V1EFZ1_TRIPS|nr:hypothetical protein T4A_459 [Trichinella pseudospiralis]